MPSSRRDGVRKRRKGAGARQSQRVPETDEPLGPATSLAGASLTGPSARLPSPTLSRPGSGGGRGSGTHPPMAFVSPSTVMSYDASRQQSEIVDGHPQSLGVKAAILDLTKAHVLPRPALLGALTDAYFKHVHPFYPVVEEDDLVGPEPSVLLQQVVCLAGSLALHDPESVKLCHSQYEKVKTLIYLNFEDDTLALLKTLCLMTCYSAVSTDQVTFDGPWHWLGMAIRMALQIGLHQSSTYERHANPGCLRRIFWQLVVRTHRSTKVDNVSRY